MEKTDRKIIFSLELYGAYFVEVRDYTKTKTYFNVEINAISWSNNIPASARVHRLTTVFNVVFFLLRLFYVFS